jgi:hypothetical protein
MTRNHYLYVFPRAASTNDSKIATCSNLTMSASRQTYHAAQSLNKTPSTTSIYECMYLAIQMAKACSRESG